MSKRIWNHPEVPAGETTRAWRSVGQLEDTPDFRQWMDREFPQGAAEMANEEEQEVSRRSFLKLMGASTALAGFGMAACRQPESYIVPYTQAPEWIIPGKALYYASAMPRSSGGVPLVVTTFEGRPTKLAPNILPGLAKDADGTDAFVQASVLDLYSPSRSRGYLYRGATAKASDFAKVIAGFAGDSAAKIGFVFGHDDSPTRARLVKELAKKYSGAKFYAYEALQGDSAAALGDGVRVVADFENADRIVSLDCDFAGVESVGPVTAFFQRRKPEGKGYAKKASVEGMNRLYVVEGQYTLTGGMADHRLRVAPSQVIRVAAQLARELGVDIASVEPITNAQQLKWIKGMAKDLQKSGSKSAVLAGSRQPAALHHIALAINTKLGSIGEGKALNTVQTEVKGYGDLAKLKTDIEGGAIEHLVLATPANPVYDAPADLDFASLLNKLKTSIHLGTRTDATATAATWHVPTAHYLEAWGDARTARGTYLLVQPMILPLYADCVSDLELLLAFLTDDGEIKVGEGSDASPAYHAVRKTFAALADESEASWKKALRDGFLEKSSYTAAPVSPNASAAATAIAAYKAVEPTTSSLEVVFSTDASVYDGRWIDNAWLQEAPDPISKLTWDNAALISPKTAKDLGVYEMLIAPEQVSKVLGIEGKYAKVSPDDEGEHRKSPMIKLKVNGQELEIAVLIAFGQADNVIVVPLGYGQGFDEQDELERKPSNGTSDAHHVGYVGLNRGFNAYPLRTAATAYLASGGTAAKIEGKSYSVALTQEHHAMYGRALAREISTMDDSHGGKFESQLANVAKQGNDAHAPPNISLYKQEDSKGKSLLSDDLHQWEMAVDLSSCTGCNACLIACQAENNIPVVGKRQVARGRAMHWIRMDRYFAIDEHNDFDKDSPAMVPQPVACVQCEAAPCETVCPVNATVHTEDGINAMAYNRCIGTRYCANNCPYKARRFNFFDYNKRNPLIEKNLYKGPFGEKAVGEAPHLQRNPNVSVRMRGVMEKCTYCVQRLKDAKIRQKRGQKQDALLAGNGSQNSKADANTLRIPVDSVKVACQEACPSDCITFGNQLDGDKAQVRRAKASERNYDLLNYIGTRPRTSYLARVKNPNPEMPDAKFIGKATIHMV